MIRRLLIPLLASGLLVGATAGSAFAKCEGSDPKPAFCSEIRVSLSTDGGVGTFVAGRPTSFDLFQAGIRKPFELWVALGDDPVDAMGVVLTFVSDADGTRLRVPATATSQTGMWTAEVLLPDEGRWSVFAQVVDVTGAAYRIEVDPVHVGKPPATPPVTTPAGPPATPINPALPLAVVLGGLVAAAITRVLVPDRPLPRKAGAGVAAASTITADRA